MDNKHKELLEKYDVKNIDLKHNVDKIKKGGLIEKSLSIDELSALEKLRQREKLRLTNDLLLKYLKLLYRKGNIIKLKNNTFVIIRDIYDTDNYIECMKIEIDSENNIDIDYEYIYSFPKSSYTILPFSVNEENINLAIMQNNSKRIH